jgi:hypothetical protein
MAQGRKTRPITPSAEVIEQLFTLFGKLQSKGFAPDSRLVNTDVNPYGDQLQPFGFSQVDRPELSMYLPALHELSGWMTPDELMNESKTALIHEAAHQETGRRRKGSEGLALDPRYIPLTRPEDPGHDALFLATQDEMRTSEGRESYLSEQRRAWAKKRKMREKRGDE